MYLSREEGVLNEYTIPSSAGWRAPQVYQSLRGHCPEQGVLASALSELPLCALPWQPLYWQSPVAGSPPGTLHQQLHVSGCSQNLQMPLHKQKLIRTALKHYLTHYCVTHWGKTITFDPYHYKDKKCKQCKQRRGNCTSLSVFSGH